MQKWTERAFAVGILIGGLLLWHSFKSLNDSIEVTTERVIPFLKQLPEPQAKYSERMLTSIQRQSSRTWSIFEVMGGVLVLNIGVVWWTSRNAK